MSGFKLLGTCECGAPCSRVGGRCRRCVRRNAKRKQPSGRRRKVYSHAEKQAALRLVRERGVTEASRRLGISDGTLSDWKYAAQALAHSEVYQPDSPEDRDALLAQLIQEQEIEMRYERRRYRHHRKPAGAMSLNEDFDSRPGKSLTRLDWVALDPDSSYGPYISLAQGHLVEWLDPVFDEVAG